MTIRSLSLAAVALAGLSLSGGAFAQVKTWNFGDTTPNGACTGNFGTTASVQWGNTINCTQQPNGTVTNLQVRAYSSDGSGPNGHNLYRHSSVNQQGTGSGFGAFAQGDTLVNASPDHAIDNSAPLAAGNPTPGADMLLLQFSAAEVLRNVTMGWSGTDGDFQVLRWTGATNASFDTVRLSIVDRQAGTLVGAHGGWQLVSTVDGIGNVDVHPAEASYSVNSGNLSSSFWLISAFNSAFGGTHLSAGNDAFKVLSVSAGNPVSAPGSLALAGLSLLGLGMLRRRRA